MTETPCHPIEFHGDKDNVFIAKRAIFVPQYNEEGPLSFIIRNISNW